MAACCGPAVSLRPKYCFAAHTAINLRCGTHVAGRPGRPAWLVGAAAADGCRRRPVLACATQPLAGQHLPPDEDDEEFEGLLPGEDTQIPGTYHDAMSGSTPLGKAVRSTCDELDALAALEQQTLADAEQLLKSMGWRGSLFDSRSSSSAASSEGATPPKSD